MSITEGFPVSGADDLENHLQQLLETPDTPLNGKLLDDVELQLTGKYHILDFTFNIVRSLTYKCLTCRSQHSTSSPPNPPKTHRSPLFLPKRPRHHRQPRHQAPQTRQIHPSSHPRVRRIPHPRPRISSSVRQHPRHDGHREGCQIARRCRHSLRHERCCGQLLENMAVVSKC